MLAPSFAEAPDLKILLNIGCLFDIPTGTYYRGKYGESLLNGGLGMLTAITGIGNNFKSTLMHYMTLSAAEKVYVSTPTYISTYDTEVNIHRGRLYGFTQMFRSFNGINILDDGHWLVSDKTVSHGNEWWAQYRKYLQDVHKEAPKLMRETPFLTRDKVTRHKVVIPSFTQIDSFTEFDTEEIAKIQDEHELGESGGNTIHMRQGLAKLRFLNEIPTLCGRSNNYMLFTAHLGQAMNIQSGPYSVPPPKKLSSMKANDKIKGVTDKFFFFMSNLWQVYDARPFQNKDTKGPEYPVEPGNPQPNDTDLNIVTVKLLRSKSGATGTTFEILVSQSAGVLPALSEFHFIKTNDRFGLSGNNVNYHLDLLPEVNLTRTSVRMKIATEPLLARALNITAELCQIALMHRNIDPDLICTPKQLYEDLRDMGYDWNILLNTRGYWMLENESQPIPFLSTMDLLRMRAQKLVGSGRLSAQDTYHPYWLAEDKKTIIAPVVG